MKVLIDIVKVGVVIFTLLVSLNSYSQHQAPIQQSVKQQIAQRLDGFHQAAALANFEQYLGSMADDAVFLGTDANERWHKDEFAAFVKPYFEQGHGWTYTSQQRHIDLIGNSAIFDELLWNDKYGLCRGTGVLVRQRGKWLIQQYSLSFTVPNDLAQQVIAITKPAYNKKTSQSLLEQGGQ